MQNDNKNYSPDVLGHGFEQLTLPLANDYEGTVIATLIRKKPQKKTFRAILYIHGFNDYFFQNEMAEKFNEQGYNFYALDLRKYGRSLLKHQKLNNVRSLLEYDEEINKALKIIKSEKNTHVILKGHSTGGLIITNYAGNNLNSKLFDGLICNSPFYEFNLSIIERKLGVPTLSFLGNYFPNTLVSSHFSELYGYSLHNSKYGTWNYSLAWKPYNIPKVNFGFIHAIHKAHKNIQNNWRINVPMLVLHSDKSIYQKKWSDDFMNADAVLNVQHIHDYAQKINGNVTLCEIKNGMHDLVLSKKNVREKVFKNIFEWTHYYIN
ncbi:alpha/beta hydrolase [Tenacibaculum aestuariivivum]|uniref:alpha/beta hydrolase n=1 Tax=Tenacibaculum aestuariivivum TaxID=2006131 RepID=UPI003AB284E1